MGKRTRGGVNCIYYHWAVDCIGYNRWENGMYRVPVRWREVGACTGVPPSRGEKVQFIVFVAKGGNYVVCKGYSK